MLTEKEKICKKSDDLIYLFFLSHYKKQAFSKPAQMENKVF